MVGGIYLLKVNNRKTCSILVFEEVNVGWVSWNMVRAYLALKFNIDNDSPSRHLCHKFIIWLIIFLLIKVSDTVIPIVFYA